MAVWWRETHTPPPWTGPGTRATHHPLREAGRTGKRFHLGDNKPQRYMPSTRPSESSTPDTKTNTVFRTPLRRCGARDGQLSPGDAFSRATIKVAVRIAARGCRITLRWVPAHKGVGGNEIADD